MNERRISSMFEIYDSDDILSEDADILETECPICGKDISFSLNDIGSTITCPHCKGKIDLASE